MKLIVIFALFIIAGIALLWFHNQNTWDRFWAFPLGIVLIVIFGTAELFAVPIFLTSKKDSEILYQQLIEEKAGLEQLLENPENADNQWLYQEITRYNDSVIEHKENALDTETGTHYSTNVDWEALEVISLPE